jgi:hypothetical protein
MKKKAFSIIVILCICLSLLVFVPQAKANPKFIIADWDDVDEYGQGINAFSIYENSTGSWVWYYGWNGTVALDANYNVTSFTTSFNWTIGLGIKLLVGCWLNTTQTGVTDEAEALNVIRVNCTVSALDGIVWSKDNMTFSYKLTIYHPMWYMVYGDTLEVLPAQGNVYTVTVTYEVFW